MAKDSFEKGPLETIQIYITQLTGTVTFDQAKCPLSQLLPSFPWSSLILLCLITDTYQPAPRPSLGDSSGASSRIQAPGSDLPHTHTLDCGCGCTPASQTAVPCRLGCNIHTHHWCASCPCKSGQGMGHTMSSSSLCSAVLGRCQEHICHTGVDDRFLGHNASTLEERFPGLSIQ